MIHGEAGVISQALTVGSLTAMRAVALTGQIVNGLAARVLACVNKIGVLEKAATWLKQKVTAYQLKTVRGLMILGVMVMEATVTGARIREDGVTLLPLRPRIAGSLITTKTVVITQKDASGIM
jgi:hypothetical protein